jgi:hypothetical protein
MTDTVGLGAGPMICLNNFKRNYYCSIHNYIIKKERKKERKSRKAKSYTLSG